MDDVVRAAVLISTWDSQQINKGKLPSAWVVERGSRENRLEKIGFRERWKHYGIQ